MLQITDGWYAKTTWLEKHSKHKMKIVLAKAFRHSFYQEGKWGEKNGLLALAASFRTSLLFYHKPSLYTICLQSELCHYLCCTVCQMKYDICCAEMKIHFILYPLSHTYNLLLCYIYSLNRLFFFSFNQNNLAMFFKFVN